MIQKILNKIFKRNKENETIETHKKQPKPKFYKKPNGRYQVTYKSNHICTCEEAEIGQVQEYFQQNYNGENITEISNTLKKQYNIKIQHNKKYKKTKKAGRKKGTWKNNKLTFEDKPSGRCQVRVMDNGKYRTVCSCNINQKQEVTRRWNNLKKTHKFNEIRDIMKNDYNLRQLPPRKPRKMGEQHSVTINSRGQIYLDGKFMKVDKEIYNGVTNHIGD